MATNRPRVQAYVSKTCYESLKSYSDKHGVSISEAVSIILQTYLTTDAQPLDYPSEIHEYVTKEQMIAYVQAELGRLAGALERELDNHQIIVTTALRHLSPSSSDNA